MTFNLNFIIDKNPIALLTQKIVNFKPINQFGQYLQDRLFTNMPNNLSKFLFTIGAITLTSSFLYKLYKIYTKLYWIPTHYIARRNVNENYLKNKYDNCYVLITGCTDGIGLSFAEQFVKMGFNLVLIARNKLKLQNVIVKLKRINSQCQFIRIIADLSKKEDILRMISEIEMIKEDIGIVINSAGISQYGLYFDIDPTTFLPDKNTNYYSMFKINQTMIPKLKIRPKRSAIINISSRSGYFNAHKVGLYSSHKYAMDILSRTLSLQNRDKVDVLSVRPFGVTTRMQNNNKGPLMITPKDCVISTLSDLGRADVTYGGFRHKLAGKSWQELNQLQIYQMYERAWKEYQRNKQN